MKRLTRRPVVAAPLALAAAMLIHLWTLASHAAAEPLQVVTTVSDLASITQSIGGPHVEVLSLARGTEDPHYIEPRASFVKALNRADLFIQAGLDLEAGWTDGVLRGARNGRILPGSAGFLDTSRVIEPIDIPAGPLDRTAGDIHPRGNPHYLLDPVNGLKVAAVIHARLRELRPEHGDELDRRYHDFRRRLGAAIVGEKLAELYEVEKLARLEDFGKLQVFLEQQGQLDLLGGWLGGMKRFRDAGVVVDHNMWNYFTRRFGLKVIGYMEPKPGLPPTTRHLGQLVRTMREARSPLVIWSVYFPARHATFLVEQTGARSVQLAHQVGATDGAGDYIQLFEYNIAKLTEALEAKPR